MAEDEIIDVLSQDTLVHNAIAEEVWNTWETSMRQKLPMESALPLGQKLPFVYWARLSFDLAPYLNDRVSDGMHLMGFFHRYITEVIMNRFLDTTSVRQFHRSLACYFDAQPLTNAHALAELPYQQTQGQMWPELHATLTRFDFLAAKVAAKTEQRTDATGTTTIYTGVYDLRTDLAAAIGAMRATESEEGS